MWWVDGDRRLGDKTHTRLDSLSADQRPRLSAISLWEVAMLVTLRRIECRPSFDAWIVRATHPDGVHVFPITAEVAMEVARLPEGSRRDPADRLIIATARVHQLRIVTADRAMLDSKLVRPWRV
jgi:PIN domain nuclease of toxin-antitoxin system